MSCGTLPGGRGERKGKRLPIKPEISSQQVTNACHVTIENKTLSWMQEIIFTGHSVRSVCYRALLQYFEWTRLDKVLQHHSSFTTS